MSEQTPRHRFGTSIGRLKGAHDNDEIHEQDFKPIVEMVAAFDDETYVEVNDGETTHRYDELLGVSLAELPRVSETKSSLTLRNYTDRLRRLSIESDVPLIEQDEDSLNVLLREFQRGEAEMIKDDGISKNTLRTYQSALRTFVKFTEGMDVDADEIEMYSAEETTVDERDMFDSEDVQVLRDATDSPRDRALLEMLLNTGQRLTAIRTLKVGNIDIENGMFYLNDEHTDGLKGADSDSRRRPLLGARGPVRDWLDYHPCRDRDDFEDAYLFTATTLSATDDYGEMMSESAVRYILDKIHEKAGVDKPSNAHNYRHYFVTNAVRNWDLDKDSVKALIGHDAQSKVMETTYSHLTMDDHIADAEVAMDLREPEEDDPSVPAVCNICDYTLPPGAKACPKCGQVYTADAKSVKEDVDDSLYEGKGAAEDDEEKEAVDKLRRLLDENPELLDEL